MLGQHVAPLPAGVLAIRPGPAFAGSDSMRATMFGRGGHGSRPETTIDPVLMAAATVLRLQTIVAREVGGIDTAVVTVGALHVGSKENIIADRAELRLSVRTFDPLVRRQVLDGIERIVRAEAQASGRSLLGPSTRAQPACRCDLGPARQATSMPRRTGQIRRDATVLSAHLGAA